MSIWSFIQDKVFVLFIGVILGESLTENGWSTDSLLLLSLALVFTAIVGWIQNDVLAMHKNASRMARELLFEGPRPLPREVQPPPRPPPSSFEFEPPHVGSPKRPHLPDPLHEEPS